MSARDLTFLERLVSNVFSPVRNTGVAAGGPILDGRMTWEAGVFRDTDKTGARTSNRGNWSITTRVSGLPLYQNKGRTLWHWGASYSYRQPLEDAVRFRRRPEAHLVPYLADTGPVPVDKHSILLGGETAAVFGPLCAQAEYMRAALSSPSVSDPAFHGWYVQVGYFLTGEHRPYRSSTGGFSRVKPKRNFAEDSGVGAWQVAMRYSTVDLDDGDIRGGQLNDVALGINWFLNPNVRAMGNYVHAQLKHVGNTEILQVRLQVDL